MPAIRSSFQLSLLLSLFVFGAIFAHAFDNSRSDNVAVYWGQDSYGASGGNQANDQQPISFYCNDDSIDALPIAFVDVFFGTGGQPELDLANTCSSVSNPVFEGTQLPNCSFLASDIQACQSAGKIVTISLGGATGSDSFESQSQATGFADTIWNIFLGGSSSTRPFGDAVLDGVDLDIEGGSTQFYPDFVNQLRSHMNGADKQYYITGAPQCPFPDAYLGSVINAVGFDALYVQFYNNYCGVTSFSNPNAWNFDQWDTWATQTSPNKDVKIYIGAPAASTAAGSGYVDAATLASIALATRQNYSSFGGIMLWDASQAYANDNYAAAVKSAIQNGGSSPSNPSSFPSSVSASSTTLASPSSVTSVTFTSAPVSSSSLEASSSSSILSSSTLLTSASSEPSISTSIPSVTLSSPPSAISVTSPALTPSASPADCSSVQAWASTVTYTGGNQVTYNGHLWTALWWSIVDFPGGAGGEWTDNGQCINAPASTSVSTASNSVVSPSSDASMDMPPSKRTSRVFRI